MGYITKITGNDKHFNFRFQSSFELMGYITKSVLICTEQLLVSKLFRAYGLYNDMKEKLIHISDAGFKALSSLWVI